MPGALRKNTTKAVGPVARAGGRPAQKRAAGAAAERPRAAGAKRAQGSKRAAGATKKSEQRRVEELVRALEQRADAAERTLRDTVYNVSHDLRTPLTVIDLSARLLLKACGQDAGARRSLDAISRAVDELNRLVQDLVDAMNLESGSLKVDREAHEVASLVDKAVEIAAPAAVLKPLELARDVERGLPPLACDRERLVQVLANLLANAIRFTPKNGKVTLRAERNGDGARFSIIDTGPGILAENRPMLFARNPPGRRSLQGMGLAAFVAKGIVEAHGGTIGVESLPGRGSTFFFTIPAAPREGAAAGAPLPAAPA